MVHYYLLQDIRQASWSASIWGREEAPARDSCYLVVILSQDCWKADGPNPVTKGYWEDELDDGKVIVPIIGIVAFMAHPFPV